ncbi:MAG: glycerophosphodiester phosphodiesterase [Bacteroidia bacterium]|nr:glycerophosphodiester phosphodiesterase [Bacteroidia bacterium]
MSKYFFLTLILFLNMSFSNLSAQNRKITVTGHRGAASYAPENTLSGISKALQLKPDRIEIDVQQTQDGIVVLMHDITLSRTTNGKGKVKNFTFEEVRKLDAASKFTPEGAFVGIPLPFEPVPSLEEAIQLINGQTQFIIEIKKGNEYYPGIVNNIVSLIQKYNAHSWCIIHSFEDSVLKAVHEADDRVVLHSVTAMRRSRQLRQMPYISEVSVYYKFATQKWIDKIHKMGKKVNVWTVNNEEDIQKMINIGVDGIISNNPDRVIQR